MPRPYPTSPFIISEPLSAEKRAVVEQLFAAEIAPAHLKKRSQVLCPHALTRQPPVDDSTKKGLAEAAASITAEVYFRREGEKSNLELAQFSTIVEFSQSAVFLQHSTPRFPSDSSGFKLPMAELSMRPLRLEGRFDADILVLVPPLRDCGVQSVALCPRRYTKNDELILAPYVAQSIRPIVTMKADGVYAPPPGSSGKIMASLLGTTGVVLPKSWFSTASGSGTLSQAIEFKTPREPNNVTQPPLPISSLPIHVAVESRVDLGRDEGSVRTVSKRVTVELSSFILPEIRDIEVGTSELTIKGGQCYLLSAWSEEVL